MEFYDCDDLVYDSDCDSVAPHGSVGGNTRTLRHAPENAVTLKKRRCNPSIYWCFTYNNYNEEGEDRLARFLNDNCKKFVYGHEQGVNCVPHLQGFACFKKKLRPVEACGIKEIHWEKSKKTNEEAAIAYCCKDWNDVRSNFDIRKYKPKRPVLDPLEGMNLFWWQKEIVDLVETIPDSRTIYWYWDELGGCGKTSLAKHLCIKRIDTMVADGSAKDVMYGIIKRKEAGFETNIVIFNFVRSKEDFVSYEAIEKIKDGLFFNTKYESEMYVGNCPHVICFANFKPKEDKLSVDRWFIKNIN